MPKSDDAEIRKTVEAVFERFDSNQDGTLEGKQIINLINVALKHLNSKERASQKDVNDLITFVDKNGDGKIGKSELFEIFKKLINS